MGTAIQVLSRQERCDTFEIIGLTPSGFIEVSSTLVLG